MEVRPFTTCPKFYSDFETWIDLCKTSNLKLKIAKKKLTVYKKKFSINNFFSKCYQIPWILRIWSHLLKKSLTENFIFGAVTVSDYGFKNISQEQWVCNKSMKGAEANALNVSHLNIVNTT